MQLRNWDRDYPEIHHELIVRYVAGAVVSLLTTSVYNGVIRGISSASTERRHGGRF
jgi:hypothetical protein